MYCLEGIAIHHDPRKDPAEFELMWLSVALKSGKLLIATIYRPPSADSQLISYLDSHTSQKMKEFGAGSIMLIGDFNVHHKEWLGSHNTDAAGRQTLQMSNCLGLQQVVTDPTRADQILDLALTDLPAKATVSASLGTCDHNPVIVTVDTPAHRDRPYQRKVWRYDKADFWNIKGHLSSVNWTQIFSDQDPEKVCSNVTQTIHDAMDLFIPSRVITKKPGDKAWFDDKCRAAARRKRRLFNHMKKEGSTASKKKFQQARRDYIQAEKAARANHNRRLREDLTDSNISSKKWWQVVNSLSGKTTQTNIPVIEENGNAHTTARDKAEAFCKIFAEKCRLPHADAPPPILDVETEASLDNITFRPKNVRKQLRRLKPDKATGPDRIPTRVLKECAAELATPLSHLFHLCFRRGKFPSQWKEALVTPVHKRDSKSDPTKYRPISLLSIMSKVMEAVVQDHLQRYLLGNNLISERQFGFRPAHSTADLLNTLSQKWNQHLDNAEEVAVIALDIKGAFDKVWHNGLLAKLKAKGIQTKLLSWIESYLSGRTIRVALAGQSSSTAPINASVPQGSILGPLLFSVFIDDLVKTCDNQLYLYADDSTLYAPISSPRDAEQVQRSLNADLQRMKSWADRWKVTFEPSKCKAMVISRRRTPSNICLFFGNCQLAIKKHLDILGMVFDSKLLWNEHISNITRKAGQRLGALRRVSNKLDSVGRACVYKSQVRSTMEYASLAWTCAAPTSLAALDNIQRKALDIIGNPQVTHAIPSLHHRRQVAAVTTLYKMQTDRCPSDLKALLPSPHVSHRLTRASVTMPDHALSLPSARTSRLDRSFLHSAVRTWNGFPADTVGPISTKGIQAFKCRAHRYLLTFD